MIVMLFGLIQHWHVRRVLARAGDLPAAPRWPPLVMALACLTAILLLAVYLDTWMR
jgi:hypothetical protein